MSKFSYYWFCFHRSNSGINQSTIFLNEFCVKLQKSLSQKMNVFGRNCLSKKRELVKPAQTFEALFTLVITFSGLVEVAIFTTNVDAENQCLINHKCVCGALNRHFCQTRVIRASCHSVNAFLLSFINCSNVVG